MADLSFEHAAPHVEPAQLKEQAEKLTAALKRV
jgi:hypothetical protein